MKKLEAWFEKEIDDDVLSAICATLIEHDAKFYVYEESEKTPGDKKLVSGLPGLRAVSRPS